MWKQKGIIVSCQAHEDEPLHGPQFMKIMAEAAYQGGAIGIRANGVTDVSYIKQTVDLPVIGILKKQYPGFASMITPTLEDAKAIAYAGADVVAIECTKKERPDKRTLKETIRYLKTHTGCKVMADISTLEEAEFAFKSGVDYIGTTLAGHTKETKNVQKPAFLLMEELVKKFPLPIIAEGGIETPEHIMKILKIGVSWIVIGSAITRPQYITEKLVNSIN